MFTRKRTGLAIAAVAVVTSLTLAGCSGGGGGGGGGGTDGGSTLALGIITPPLTFSAVGANWANHSPYLQAVYDTVVNADADGTIVPNLATEWSYNDDNTVLTMTIRDDVTFTDGSTLDADAIAQNIIRFRDGTSPNASNLINVSDATAPDATTLEITLSVQDPALLTYLSQNAGLVENPAAFSSEDIDTVPAGSGPYILNQDDSVVGTSYVFDRNEDYWNPDAQYYDELDINVYADGTALLNAIQGGQINASATFDNSTLDQIQGAGWSVISGDAQWAGMLIGDRAGTLQPELADPRVRQAINYAFDRDALLEAVGQGYGTVTSQIFPPTSPGYDESLDSYYTYDPEMARDLLTQAGYPDGFSMTMPSTGALGPAAFALFQQQLADVGITVTYEDLQINDYINAIIAASYPMAWFQLQEDPVDSQLVAFQVSAASLFNVFHYSDPTVEQLATTIQTGSADESAAASQELNRYLVEQAWFAPLYRPQTSFVLDATTTGEFQVGNSYPYLYHLQPAS